MIKVRWTSKLIISSQFVVEQLWAKSNIIARCHLWLCKSHFCLYWTICIHKTYFGLFFVVFSGSLYWITLKGSVILSNHEGYLIEIHVVFRKNVNDLLWYINGNLTPRLLYLCAMKGKAWYTLIEHYIAACKREGN